MKRFSILNIRRLASQHCALAVAVCAAVATPGTTQAQNPVLAGLDLWLDASASATTMTLTGSTVTEWRDKNGSLAKVTLQGGAPTLQPSGIGGVPTVHFDNTSWMNDGVNHEVPVTILYVSRESGGHNGRVLGGYNNNWGLGYNDDVNNWYYLGGSEGSGSSSDTSAHLYAATIQGSGLPTKVYANGAVIGTPGGNNSGPNNLELNGWNYAGSSDPTPSSLSDCDISEVLVYNRILTSDELNAVGYYLAVKYSLTTHYIKPGPQANITGFTFPTYGAATINGTNITKTVPHGTPVTAMAPTFTLSDGATCVPASGTTSDFSSSVHYIVHASDYTTSGTATDYTVTVTVAAAAPPPPAGLGVAAGLVAWYDASQLIGLTDGNTVDTWPDLSGCEHTASRIADNMTYVTGQVNNLPAVQFRNGGYADIAGTMFAKEQYIVLRNPDNPSGFTQWGAALGNVTDQCGYMMGDDAGSFWGSNMPAAVSNNGTVLTGPDFTVSNDGVFIILKIDGAYPDTNLRNYSLGNCYGNGAAQYHTTNLDVAEIIAYDRELAAEQETALGAYLTVKYNITASTYPTATPATYATWATDPAHTLTGGPTAVGHDGLINLLVYALDLKTNGSNGAPGTLTADGVLSFAKRPAAVTNGDVTYAIEISSNLRDEVTSGDGGWHTTTDGVTDNPTTISYLLPKDQGKIFARLKVVSTAP